MRLLIFVIQLDVDYKYKKIQSFLSWNYKSNSFFFFIRKGKKNMNFQIVGHEGIRF
jgi:hypothetical protein